MQGYRIGPREIIQSAINVAPLMRQLWEELSRDGRIPAAVVDQILLTVWQTSVGAVKLVRDEQFRLDPELKEEEEVISYMP